MEEDRRSLKFWLGLDAFLEFELANAREKNSICCPCSMCFNNDVWSIRVIKEHIVFNGIDVSYKRWKRHGEPSTSATNALGDSETVHMNPNLGIEGKNLRKRKAEGGFTSSGSYDVLTIASENPEHHGRVRGVGGNAKPAAYLNLPKPQRKSMKQTVSLPLKKMIKEEIYSMLAEERVQWEERGKKNMPRKEHNGRRGVKNMLRKERYGRRKGIQNLLRKELTGVISLRG